MIGKYTRLLAALLVFAPTSLSSAEATAGQRDNGRGFRVIAGDTHGAYRKHRRQNKRIRAVAVKFSASTHGSNGVSRFERLEPLQLYPVSSFQKVTTRQLTIGQQRAQLRASLGRPDPETGWIVICPDCCSRKARRVTKCHR